MAPISPLVTTTQPTTRPPITSNQHHPDPPNNPHRDAVVVVCSATAAVTASLADSPPPAAHHVRYKVKLKQAAKSAKMTAASAQAAEDVCAAKEAGHAEALAEKKALRGGLDEQGLGWLSELARLRSEEKRLADERQKHNKVVFHIRDALTK